MPAHFDVEAPGVRPRSRHGDQDPPLRGLEPVADVGQGPADDDAHRVGQVAVLEFFVDGPGNKPSEVDVATRRRGFLGGSILGGWWFGREVGIGGQAASFRRQTARRAGPKTRFSSGRFGGRGRGLHESRIFFPEGNLRHSPQAAPKPLIIALRSPFYNALSGFSRGVRKEPPKGGASTRLSG